MEIQSVQQFLEHIDDLKKRYTYVIPRQNFLSPEQVIPPEFIYRGHSNHDKYKLLPGIFRWFQRENGTYTTEFSPWEYNILFDFISEACGIVKDIHAQEIVPWLETAQHFGVPTRLLDFTGNPLVALYFACIGSPGKNASVWIVNKSAYNRAFYGELYSLNPAISDSRVARIITDEIINQNYQDHNNPSMFIQYPWIYKPFYRNERMNTQSSVFMIWGANRGDFTSFLQPAHYMKENDNVTNQEIGILNHVIIPSNQKGALLKQLEMCGVNEKFIYPGLDGIGRYIRKKYSNLT